MWEKMMGNTLKWNWFKGEEPLQAKPILRRKKYADWNCQKQFHIPKIKNLNEQGKLKILHPIIFLWYITYDTFGQKDGI